MVNLTPRQTAACLTLLSLVASGACRSSASARAESQRAPAVNIETREYRAKNGHALAITPLGGIVGLRGPKLSGADAPPIRDGYKLTYLHPRDGKRVVASTAAGGGEDASAGSSNLVPVWFEAPPSGTVVTDDEPLTAKVIVRTRDGLLRLTHLLVWKPGSDSVSVQTEIANSDARQAASVVAFERTFDVAGERDASKNQVPSEGKSRRFVKGDPRQNDLFVETFESRCSPHCPPPPPIHFRVFGEPNAVSVIQPPAAPPGIAKGRPDVSRVSRLSAGKQPGGASRASLLWEFKSPLRVQTPIVFTTYFAPLDAATR